MATREHFTNARCLAFATASAIIIASFGAEVSGWQHWISIGVGYGVGVTLLVWAAVEIAKSFLISGQPSSSLVTTTPAANTNIGGVQANGGLNVGGMLMTGGTLHQISTPQQGVRAPLVHISDPIPINVSQIKGVKWVRQYDGHSLLALAISNSSGTDTNFAAPAEGVVVSLQFDDCAGPVRYIPRLFWVDHTENAVSIKIGTYKYVLLEHVS